MLMPLSFSIKLPIDLGSELCMKRLFGMDQMDSCVGCITGLFLLQCTWRGLIHCMGVHYLDTGSMSKACHSTDHVSC